MSNQGAFIWYELMTSDVEGALAFYTEVVGWRTHIEEASAPAYHILQAGTSGVAGVMPLPSRLLAGGIPPHWLAHVAVKDVGVTAGHAVALGGRVLHPPMDVAGGGRSVTLADPQGAVLCAFSPAEDFTPDMHGPGRFSWHELRTTDPAAAVRFYTTLLGWTPDAAVDIGDTGACPLFRRGSRVLGGVSGLGDTNTPAWIFCIAVDDLGAALGRVQQHGGTVLSSPVSGWRGARSARCLDPQGALFALRQPGALPDVR